MPLMTSMPCENGWFASETKRERERERDTKTLCLKANIIQGSCEKIKSGRHDLVKYDSVFKNKTKVLVRSRVVCARVSTTS